VDIYLEPPGSSLDALGIGSNSSVTDLVVEYKEVIGGGIGGLVLLAGVLFVLRRRSSYDDDL